jgi:SAM-dependent MidA family methyltransferase
LLLAHSLLHLFAALSSGFITMDQSIHEPLTVTDVIKQKIEQDGPVSFRDFMEMALYYPSLGYYTSAEEKIGRNGDFYTSSDLTPVFGAMLGRQLEEMYHLLGGNEFTIVEYGSGNGLLCRHILAYLKTHTDLYNKLNYCMIEKSPVMRQLAQERLKEKVSWHDSVHQLPPIKGCVLSNELVDNLAVHQVVMGEELMEVFVDYTTDFVEVLKPASPALKNYLAELRITLPKGFRTEINLDATAWIEEVAGALQQGYVITIDYGYPSWELYNQYRRNGTLVCYKKHKTNCQPYTAIGEQDITAHVNFSALGLWGFKHGLEHCGYREQGGFLSALGFKDYLKMDREKGNNLSFEREALLSHLLLEDMGSKYKVLIQQKNMQKYQLSGLKT